MRRKGGRLDKARRTEREQNTRRGDRGELVAEERERTRKEKGGRKDKGREGFAKGRTAREQSGCQATDIVPIVAGVA